METATRKPWIAIATAVIAIAYAWMSARTSEPRLSLPREIEGVLWIEHGKVRSARAFSHLGYSHFREWTHILRETNQLSHELYLLGRFKMPVSLVINVDHPRAYSVSERRIELGLDVAASDAQILKGVTKAWILQEASDWVQSSQLRTEVVSDFVTAIIRGKAEFGALNAVELALRPSRLSGGWLSYVKTYSASCNDPWIPLELLRNTDCATLSSAINPLMFRPLLDDLLIGVYDSVSPLARMDFARQFIEGLKVAKLPHSEPPRSLGDWRTALRNQFVALVPQSAADGMSGILNQSDLAIASPLQVALTVKGRWSDGESVVQIGRDGHRTLAGVALTAKDETSLESRWYVTDSSDSIAKLLLESRGARKILFVIPPRAGIMARLSGLVTAGIEAFARENRDFAFVQLDRAALDLAIKKGALSGNSSLRDLANATWPIASSREKYSPLLGFNEARWVAIDRAYRIVGAIEAVEWMRPLANQPAISRI